MANLSQYAQTIVLYNSTSADVGGTGVSIAVSTAGSSGTGAFSSTPGGYPWCSTAIQSSVSLAGFEGVRFTAAYTRLSTGLSAGTSGIVTLQAYFSRGTTDAPTNWVAIKDAYAQGFSTGGGSQGFASTLHNVLVVDVYRPKLPAGFTAVSAIYQAADCSGSVTIIADRYGAKRYTNVAYATTNYSGLQTGAPTTGTAPTVSVGGTT